MCTARVQCCSWLGNRNGGSETYVEPTSTRRPSIAWSDQVAVFAIIELDRTGIVQSWNSGAERIKGYSRDEIIGEHFSRFYRPEDRERGVPQALLTSALAHGYVEDTGWRVRSDGTLFWAHVTITAVRNSVGTPTGFVKIVRDLTASKRADDELNAFLRSFVHDFLSPVTAVRGYVDLLREGVGDADEMLGHLEATSDHLLAMATALAERVRDDPPPRRDEVAHAGTLVREAAGLVLPGDLFGRLSFSLTDDAAVQGDATELRRAVQNVLENAAKYSESTIDVDVQATDDTVDIVVRDRGRGIHPDDLPAILDDGVRGRMAGDDDGGSGIGLASAARAVANAGGTIELESSVGHGTTVRIRLPRALDETGR
ncbi:PAS domain-containing sensor histidine kinase [Microbacterium sp. Gd 4-13]|nr:PAS domain-containing sensor histidine kinase [Microbacterium sp. Gd 4-13]